MSATDTVLELADDMVSHLRATSAQARLRDGLPVLRFDDASFEETRREAAYCRDGLAALARVPLGGLAREEWLLARLLSHSYASGVEAEPDYWLTFAVTPYSGGWPLASVHQTLAAQPLATAADRAEFLGLVRDYARLLQQVADKTEQQAERGIRVPRPALAGARATLAGMRASARRLLATMPALRAGALPTEEAAAFAAELAALADVAVGRAYDRLDAVLDDRYERLAPDAVGLGSLPGGQASYRRRIARSMGAPLDVAAIHERGLADVAALERRMSEVRDALGFRGTRDEFHEGLRADPRFIALTPDDVERRYLSCMARVEPELGRYFTRLPRSPCTVKRVDAAAEAGMTFGYYQVPTAADPVGYYRYNGSNLAARPLVTAAHLIYHELMPGHHLHLALEFENEAVHPLRKFLYYGAFAEGWAEYAAGLAEEMGLYDDPYDLYGHLASGIFLAARLVVDTGLNALGWPLEHARRFMREHVLEPDALIDTETLRYSTDLYGQALDYRLGYHCFGDLRRHAESSLGDAFDLRRFHDVVIGSGGMPLEVLREQVDWYLRSATGVAA